MEVTFGYTSDFKHQIKRLMKKYPSLRKDYDILISELTKNPLLGVDLGNGIRKVRMAIASKGKGKYGGARVITYSLDETTEIKHIDLLAIYDKSEISNVKDTYIQSLVDEINKIK